MTFKPMLAGKCPADLDSIRYPVLASAKLDGIRCIIKGGALSRSLKPIPNAFVQQQLAGLPDGIDGELMIGGGFNAVTSGIMSRDGEPDFTFYVFDWDTGALNEGFETRLERLAAWVKADSTRTAFELAGRKMRVQLVPHAMLHNSEELLVVNAAALEQGYEGTMIRDPKGLYKYGRSTTKEGGLLKLKHFDDEEATIIALEEMMHNANEATTNELGRTQRSTHKDGMVPMGTLGKFVCRFDDGTEFRCGGGPGVTQELRQQLWDTRETEATCIGKRATIRFQPDPGGRQPGQAPRIPQFHGIREDLS